MSIALPFLYTLALLIFGVVITAPLTRTFRSLSLLVATSWVAGQIVAVGATYLVCALLAPLGASDVLYKVSIAFMLCVFMGALGSLAVSESARERARRFLGRFSGSDAIFTTTFLVVGGLFGWMFFSRHLSDSAGAIRTSDVYWDLSVHLPIIQLFALGDNFPAENDSLAGVALTYHFFFDLCVAINTRLGEGLVHGLNYTSIVALCMMLLAGAGLIKELFGSHLAPWVFMLLVVTSGSLRYVFDVDSILSSGLSTWLSGVLEAHPYHFAFMPGNYAGYNGNMLNMFYFLAERQMMVAITFLIAVLALLYHRGSFGSRSALLLGMAAGVFIKWHLFVAISAVLAVLVTLMFGEHRKQSLLIILGMCISCGLEIAQLRAVMNQEFFPPTLKNYPRFNPYFATMGGEPVPGTYPLTVLNFIRYYVFAFGFRLLLLPWVVMALWRLDRRGVVVVLAGLIPTLVCVNTLQLSPLSIYENHKWLKPAAVLWDILLAAFLVTSMWARGGVLPRVLAACLLLCSCLGGAIELVPYVSRTGSRAASSLYADTNSSLTRTIREQTDRHSVFVASNTLEVHLAGRKTFLSNTADEPGPSIVSAFNINEAGRREIQRRLYSVTNRADFCLLGRAANVDYLEVSAKMGTPAVYSGSVEELPISGLNRLGEGVGFLSVGAFCGAGEVAGKVKGPQIFPYTRSSDFADHQPVYLSSLTPVRVEARFSPPKMDQSWSGGSLSVAGQKFERGVGLHASTIAEYSVPPNASYFQAVLGLDEDVVFCGPHTARIRIMDDAGRQLYDSGLLRDPTDARYVYVDVRSAKSLLIDVADAGDGIDCDHVDLANALFLVPKNASEGRKKPEGR